MPTPTPQAVSVPVDLHSEIVATTALETAVADSVPYTLSTAVATGARASESAQARPSPSAGDKVIVMGKLQREDADWVAEFLPDWQHAIYTVDNTSHPFHTDVNKGREANAYLLYVINHYHDLPSTIAFIHPHRDGYPEGWHTDALNYDNVNSLTALNLDFVQRNGYANLRCIWIPGCPDEIQLHREFDTEGRTGEQAMPDAWPALFGDVPVPETIGAPCCAQFAVSRDQVLKRPLDDYKHYHAWLMETPLDDDTSGRVFEYLWHVIFGQDPV